MTDVASQPAQDTQPHEVDALHRFLTIVASKLPWHSEDEQTAAMNLLRDSEAALKGDAIDSSPAVVPPASVPPTPPAVAPTINGPMGPAIDYDRLAASIVAAQSQQAQASAAVEADPSFEPPGAVTAADTESHAAAQ